MPQLNIQIGGNASGFFATLQQVRAASAKLNTTMGANLTGALRGQVAGLAGGIGLAALTHKTLEYAGRINDLSERLGISTDALQEFDYAARQNGASLEDMTGAMQKLAVARQEALDNPRGDQMRAFAALGISVQQLKNARLEDLFRQVGKAIQNAASPQQVLSEAIAVMGRGAPGLFAAMRAGLSEAADEAQRLGLVMREDVIRSLDDLGDALSSRSMGLVATFGPALLQLMDWAQAFLDMVKQAGAYLGGLTAGYDDVAMTDEERTSPFGWLSHMRRALANGHAVGEQAVQREMEAVIAREQALIRGRQNRRGMGGGEGFDGRGNQRIKDAEEIERIEQRIAKMRRDNLPPDERRLAIEREIEEAMRRAKALQARQDFGAAEKKALLHEEERILQLENELEGIKAQKQAGSADRFAQIGRLDAPLSASVSSGPDAATRFYAEQARLAQIQIARADAQIRYLADLASTFR